MRSPYSPILDCRCPRRATPAAPHIVQAWPAAVPARRRCARAGHELRVALSQLTFAIPDVVLQPGADVSAHGHRRHAPSGSWARPMPQTDQMRTRRQHFHQVLQLLQRSRRAAASNAEHELEPEGRLRACPRRSVARRSRRDPARSTRSRVSRQYRFMRIASSSQKAGELMKTRSPKLSEPQSKEAISGASASGAIRSSSVVVPAPPPVLMLITTVDPEASIRSRTRA